MKTFLSCEFNMDTARVESKYSDGRMIAIDTIAKGLTGSQTVSSKKELD